ncbi:ABC transporter ATP-binding protein [Halomonas elongata]|uniref:ABC-type transport system ATP-binding protein n=1 Tax=Halomonas elongata (strain ATCC 33173 / DSM 2581 / NBRC 15536 / NCIMB 2198 / 1H9) TaxID=768066 RepID=E1VCL5_HALED|nr:sn-glycerol-3-phosphate ABC transporter ATP-binding protein UgpC [Halomonas elongata]RAW08888.1 sn-glycerol-3-phosphate ABC transporter ATP-binding protein UgpC [Halomonas elongata]WBF19655.1 sn-glycerol-3-phosphate ABC transporter ATP-binding protein UgpC [Halomonas elongata]WPU48520.1 sn-glycerol-3-phosphate ABC transporter ATP-binding protein UgpC [Halomonas elongata DSM 2581]CBV42370.1 ABC-type transport system ATP-binding protein [Halomonas elongata DSM 2581]
MATLQLNSVVKRFDETQVIQGVDLEVKDQEFVVFVGPSGCGKSTLLRMIAGLESTTSGDIVIEGQRVNDLGPAERGLAMVFQSYALYPHMTVEDNMGFSLRLAGVDKEQRHQKVLEAARILQLEPLLDRKPKALSGGQRQRVAIGRAIVRNPSIFLFDEPLSNLDAALRVQMRIELARLHEELKATMIYVTHDQIEAMTMADKIVVLQGGVVEQVGSPMELYHHPRNRFVAGFIGSPKMNFLPVSVVSAGSDGVEVRLPGGDTTRVPVDGRTCGADQALTLGIRPEHLTLDETGPLRGRIQVIERLGGQTSLYVEMGDDLLTLMVDGDVTHGVGDEIRFNFEPRRGHLFTDDDLALESLERHPLAYLTRRDNRAASDAEA